MSQFDNVIFGKKKFSDVLEEIYNNQKKKDQQVIALINELKPLISDIGDATLVVPLINPLSFAILIIVLHSSFENALFQNA